jgi:hypothetical protein
MNRIAVAQELVKLAKGLVMQAAMDEKDIREGSRFYDPRRRQEGKLVKRKYHQTTLWMMLFDDGIIEELTNADLKKIEKIP